MKKKGLWAVILAVCLLLAGCGGSIPAGENTTPDTTPASVQTDTRTAETPVSESGSDGPDQTEQNTEAETEDNESVFGYPVFYFESKTVTLNSGYDMPILGLGMFSLSDSEAENSTYWALKAGFRLIDTARIYGNEASVGRGLRRAIDEGIVTREEVFITTKMWTSDYDNGDAAIDASLERLGVDYIDLMILHHSQPSNDVDAYQAMERAVEAGKRVNHLQAMKAAATTWKARRARINTISPGIIVTPLAYDEFSAAGEGYQKMIDASAAERTGTSDEIAEAGAFLLGEHAGFITGTDLLIDGGVIASIRTGSYKLHG